MPSFNRALGAAILFVTAAAAPAAAQSATVKVAYVNSQTILSQIPGRTRVDSMFEADLAGYKAIAMKLQDSLQAMVATYRKVEPTLTVAQKEARTSKISEFQNNVQQKMSDLEQQSQARQMELNRPLVDQVKLVLEDVRVEGGYTMIFDVGGQVNPIVAIDKNLDITDRVTAKLRTMPIPAIGGKAPAVPTKPVGTPVGAPAGVKPPTKP